MIDNSPNIAPLQTTILVNGAPLGESAASEVPPSRAITISTIVADYLARHVATDVSSAEYERFAEELLAYVLRAIEQRVAERMGELPAAVDVALRMQTRALDRGVGFAVDGTVQAELVQPRRHEGGEYDDVVAAVLVALDVVKMIR